MRPSRSSAGALAAAAALAALAALGGCGLFHTDPPASCPTDRTVNLGDQADVTAFATCTTARGVAIHTGASIDVSKLTLVHITGDLVIGPTVGVESISLSELREVDGAIVVMSNGSMHGLFLPRLEHAGRIAVDGNVSLSSIAMPRLESVTGTIAISDNHDLEVLDAQALVTIGGDLVIANHPELTVLELGALQSAAEIRLEADPKLPADVLAAVRAHAAPP